jgi:hypothetical protein
MSSDLEKARNQPLFNSTALTELLWAPQSRKDINRIIVILQNEPLFDKRDKYVQRGSIAKADNT